MSEVTVTFDPQDIILMSDIAREVGVGVTVARTWILRRLANPSVNPKLPPPLFTMYAGGNNNIMVWRPKDGKKIIATYKHFREELNESTTAPAPDTLINA